MNSIGENIHVIHCRPNGPGGIVKAVLLLDEHELTLVDSGISDADAEIILKLITDIGRRPGELKRCVITHKHRDHTGGLKRLKQSADLEVMTHELEAGPVTEMTGLSVSGTLKDGQVLPICGGLQVIHMPGHTPGSIALFLPKHKTLLAGDTVFSAGQWLIAPPAYLCEDHEKAKGSVQKLLDLNLEIQSVVVGHGEDLREKGSERLNLVLTTKRPF